MGKVKYYDSKSEMNRNRVKKCRAKQKLRREHEKRVKSMMDIFNGEEVKESVHVQTKNDIDDDDTSTFKHKLKCWVVNHRISARALNDLLVILIFAGFSFLPKDSRTFMATPSKLLIHVLNNGKMWYNGIKKCMENIFINLSREISVTLDFNFDGFPIAKSSNAQFWPILSAIQGNLQHVDRNRVTYNISNFAYFSEFPNIQPMVIGIWAGDSKPNLNEYLLPLVTELDSIISNGININSHHVAVKMGQIICDTPARAFIKGINY